MKSAFVAMALSSVLLGGAGSAAAQEVASPEPAASTGPEAPAEPLTLCVGVTSDAPLVGVDAATLLQALRDDEAAIEILDAEACAEREGPDEAADPSPTPTPAATASPTTEPTATPPTAPSESDPVGSGRDTSATSDARAYADFVARGVTAAVRLGELSEKYEGAEGVRALDRAAGDLNRWAKAQIRWLDRHPPRACYAKAHAQWRRGAAQIRDGSKALQAAIDDPRARAIRRAARKLTAGVQNLAGVDLDPATRACVRVG